MIEGYDPIASYYRASTEPQTSVVDHIARLCANAVADLCAVYLRHEPSAPVAFATRIPGQYAALRDVPFDDLYGERAREAGIARLLYEPLIVDRNAIGSVVLGCGLSSAAELTPSMCDLVSLIISNAIAQASQLAHHHHVSERLQRAMLPARLVEAEGIAFDAAYSPASGEAEVGGDWYDAFDVGNGTIGISVGDVMGHGLEAAVTMSEIRSAIRAAAATHTAPTALLNAVDSMVSSQSIGLASAIAGIYDPITHVLRYACAGHPPPVLVTMNGDAYLLPGGGMLIGLGEPSASPERTVTLAPGTSCFFYTDGLVEHRRDVLAGEERLLTTLETMARAGALGAHELHERIIGPGAGVDDCATLAIHRNGVADAGQAHYVYSALPCAARVAREAVRAFAERANVPAAVCEDIVIAAGEAVANAIEHGDRAPDARFSIELLASSGDFTMRIASDGHWRSAGSQPDRGRGMHIMRACAQHMEVSSTYERTLVTLAFSV
jgi:anti-sigma regulatory factor (Ser/Thr protein kinase)